jgi:site-specific recombinase XerD
MQHNLRGGIEMMEDFKNWLAANGKSANTIKSYIANVGQYMNWYQESFSAEMTELLHSNILDYRSYLRSVKKLKAVTVNAKLASLISFNVFMVETGRQKSDAVSRKELLRIQASYVNPSELSEKEVDAFRQLVLLDSGVRDHAIVTVLAYAGLRISEALSLMVSDVDCIGREITVNEGKGNKERLVFIGDKVVHAVKEYLKERDSESPWLFPGRYGERLHRSVINKMFKKYSETITPHLLRHFYCSNALEKNYSIHEVANQAGHSNIHTTIRYTNPARETMKNKANKL